MQTGILNHFLSLRLKNASVSSLVPFSLEHIRSHENLNIAKVPVAPVSSNAIWQITALRASFYSISNAGLEILSCFRGVRSGSVPIVSDDWHDGRLQRCLVDVRIPRDGITS